MTQAVRKLDHAIEYLKARAGRVIPFAIRDGMTVDNIESADHKAMMILAGAMCRVVSGASR